MKSSGLQKWLMIPVIALVIFAGIHLFSHHSKQSKADEELAARQLTAQESKDLGVGGDTPHDTVATLVSQVKQLRGEVKAALENERAQKEENERLRARESTVDTRIQETLNNERERLHQEYEQTAGGRQQTHTHLEDLQHRLDNLGGKSSHEDLPIGLGLKDGEFEDPSEPRLRWYEPLDRLSNAKGASSPSPSRAPVFHLAGESPPIAEGTPRQAREADSRTASAPSRDRDGRPAGAGPGGAARGGAGAGTARVGRVPVDGTVNDPFPFKVVKVAVNLNATGLE